MVVGHTTGDFESDAVRDDEDFFVALIDPLATGANGHPGELVRSGAPGQSDRQSSLSPCYSRPRTWQVWVVQFGSDLSDVLVDVAVGPADGYLYVSGFTTGSVARDNPQGSKDIVVAVLDSDGAQVGRRGRMRVRLARRPSLPLVCGCAAASSASRWGGRDQRGDLRHRSGCCRLLRLPRRHH